MNKIVSILIAFVLLHTILIAQPYAEEIRAFKEKDSIAMPAKGQILLAGSSSFTLWRDVQNYFPAYPILNRGFGGSSLTDLIYYAEEVIFKYEPKQIIIYCGENDFAGNDTLYPAQVAQRFFDLFAMIRARYKKVPIAYISMKPSPARQHLMPKFNVANVMIRNFLKKKKRTTYIDVYHKMLDKDGKPMTDIFGPDNLHMNAKGYAIWKELIEPVLIK
ncbi:MAG: GDSL-type esterase/lipase family protein [Bacteroidetes bacterium]|nr:GDSL-type esterase/lipase family protein [Bacteroidota bacterium]